MNEEEKVGILEEEMMVSASRQCASVLFPHHETVFS
jgi:hypothetical protein